MSGPPYNPCNDGLPAKVWECLRRNSEFRSLLDRERAVPQQSRALSWEATTGNEQNVFAQAALTYLLPTRSKRTHCTRVSKPQVDERMAWPQTPPGFRAAIERAASFHWPLPNEVLRPPVEAMGRLTSSAGRAPLLDWLVEANRTWLNYDVIAVPKFVRDTEHRKAIEKDLRQRIRITGRKGRTLTNEGSAFGTTKEWDVFLFVERRISSGDTKLAARRKAAVEFYGREASLSHQFLTAEKAAKIADQIDTKQGTHIANRLAAVERAIADVYPGLMLFV